MKKIFALIFVIAFIFTGQAGQTFACQGTQCLDSSATFWQDLPKWTIFTNFFENFEKAGWSTCPGTQCLDFGATESNSSFTKDAVGVTTDANSNFSGEFFGSGFVRGGSYAGGQANVGYNTVSFTLPAGTTEVDNKSTQNFGQALGGFNYSIATGDKLYCLVNLPTAKAAGKTKGDVAQNSTDTSSLTGPTWSTSSTATQQSVAGFEGANSISLSGKDKTAVGGFTGDSTINGITYTNSYKGQDGDVQFVGASSGANNSTITTITGAAGTKYTGGGGAITGASDMNIPDNTTSGKYAGQFCCTENGFGSADGSTVSNYQMLGFGAIVGTQTSIATINIPK